VTFRVAGADREELLQAALQGLPLPDDVDREALLSLFLARERLGTTAVGDGVAIPHPRCPLVLNLPRSAVRLSFLAQPHDFGAPDGKPVDTLFLMVCRTVHEHLKLLARLATVLRSDAFRQVLAQRATPGEIIAALRREETVP
jgi:PTS system nitrogen regulatory IIA component